MSLIIHVDDVPFKSNLEEYQDAPEGEEGKFKDLTKVTGTDDLNIGVGWAEPGQTHMSHHHPDASEFYYVLEGSAEIIVGDEMVQARPGTFCYIPAGVSHKIVNNTGTTLVLLFGYTQPKYQTIWDK